MRRSRSNTTLQRFRRTERWRRLCVDQPLVDLELTPHDLLDDLDRGLAGPWGRP